MLLVLPEQKLGCLLLMIVRTSSPTIAKPHVVGSTSLHHHELPMSNSVVLDFLIFSISPTIIEVLENARMISLVIFPLIIDCVINIPKTETVIKINFVIKKFEFRFVNK